MYMVLQCIQSCLKTNMYTVYTLFVRVHIKQGWNFLRDTTTQDTFVRVHIKQYWHFQRATTRKCDSQFSEFISHNISSGSYHKIILHISSEFISNNIGTSRVTTKQYYEIILFYNFLSNKNDIFRELLWNITDFFHRRCTKKYFFLRCELILNFYWQVQRVYSEKFLIAKVKNNIVSCWDIY